MPVLSGAQVLDICRSDPGLSNIPIIVMTQEEEAERDPLTGLYSGDFFFEYIRQIEQYNDAPMDAIVIDIEHFHLINEIFGRDEGDRILKKVASLIESELKDGFGIACRLSADTFFIYHSCPEDHMAFANRMIAEMDSLYRAPAKIRIRIGINKDVDRNDTCEQ
ncbi:MAG: diguanylate cyclase [Lachnospiraceae bacterium]|nr:diguanylate cyclase [Lachnospiraceae bacterium]